MKKILIICLFFTTFLFANVAKVVAITGEAVIIRDTVKLKLEKDSDIFKNDEIETKQNTKVQLLFKDNTIITIGKNSTFKINDYIFDEKNKEYNAQFGLIQGTFRTITGKIGKLAPEKFKLKSKNSSIGIRGTQILSNIQANREIIFCTEGTIEIVSLLTNEIIVINAGEYIELKANEPIQIKKFDTTSILETDENTKFLSNEETEKLLSEFGFELNETPTTNIEQNEQTQEVTTQEVNEKENYDELNSLPKTTNETTKITGYNVFTTNISSGVLEDNKTTITDTNGDVNLNLQMEDLLSNFENDGVYSGTLTLLSGSKYNSDTNFILGSSSYSSKPDKADGTYNTADDVQWGEWNAMAMGNDYYYFAGYWILGTQTKLSEIQNLINNSASATYNGYALGYGSNNFDATTSTVALNMNFGAKSLSGSFNLSGTTINVAGNLSTSGFNFNATGTATGGGEGKFYGENAKSVGGKFNFNEAGYDYAGVFKASK